MDTIKEFIEKLLEEFEDLEKGSLKPETNYREIEDWNSMYALILIALADTEYDVTLTGEDLRNSNTVQDVYSLIESRKK